MTKQDGKSLEELVAYIESVLIPAGLEVETNDKVYDDDGNQIAEFDVCVRGKIGSTDFNWLIECRDRPSVGAAPASWIEQLVGRRDRFNLNKVTAVSTTGFAPGAVAYANQSGIELRTVETLAPNSFSDWLVVREIEQIERRARLDHITLLLGEGASEAELALLRAALPEDIANAAILKRSVDGALVLCRDAFASAASIAPGAYDGAVPNGDPKLVRLHVRYESEEDHFVVEVQGRSLRIDSIVFSGALSISTSLVPLVEAVEYAGASSTGAIAQVARFQEMGSPDLRFTLEMRKITASGETHIVARPVRSKS